MTRGALLAALKRPDCAHLEDALAARRVPVGSWTEARSQLAAPSIVLLRVVEARRRIVLTLQAEAGAGVAVQNPQEVLRALGLGADPRARLVDGELAVQFTGSGARAVVIDDPAPVPVAFTPVALPRVRVDTALSAGAVPDEIGWYSPEAPDFGSAFAEALAAWQQRLAE